MEQIDLGGMFRFVRIPGGTFLMGSGQDEAGREEDEGPRHEVTITRPFHMSVTPVTQRQFAAVMHRNPSHFQGEDLPVENVSWLAAGKFCLKLSRGLGHKFRLPTEAEWEHACRVGSEDPYSFGRDPEQLAEYAWYWANSNGETHPVATKKPNDWGLYDMCGNVCEWCRDRYADHYAGDEQRDPKGPKTGPARVLRGGCWAYDAEHCRSAYRDFCPAEDHSHYNGFRVVLHTE
jgi:formylglycine-generating enzyme required for sulfatase activity